jgi:hypothetical protein
VISPLVQHLPKLWELMHHYGMTTHELNPIRLRPGKDGRLTPVACDFGCGFDRDDPRWQRLGLPDHLFAADTSDLSRRSINSAPTRSGVACHLREPRSFRGHDLLALPPAAASAAVSAAASRSRW